MQIQSRGVYVPYKYMMNFQYDYPRCFLGGLKITSNKEQNKHVFFQSLSLSIVRNPDTVDIRSNNSGLGQFIVEEGFFTAIKISAFSHSVKIQNDYPLCLYYITSQDSKHVHLDFSGVSSLGNKEDIIVALGLERIEMMEKLHEGSNQVQSEPNITIPYSDLIMTFDKQISYQNSQVVFTVDNEAVILIPRIAAKTIKSIKPINTNNTNSSIFF